MALRSNLTASTLIVLDDNDMRISSSSSTGDLWNRSENLDNATGGNGKAYNGSLMYTREFKSNMSLAFEFEGNYVALYGTLNTQNETDAPRYSCKIDNDTDISPDNHHKTGDSNNVVLCESDLYNIESGNHTVVLTVEQINTQYPKYYPLWFDYAVYQPTGNSASSSQEVQRFYSGDSNRVKLSPSKWSQIVEGFDTWNMLAIKVQGTDDGFERLKDAKIEIAFQGDTFRLYGFTPTSNYTQSTAFYSLDGDSPVNFTLPAGQEGVRNFNQLWVNLTGLAPGNHTIVVEDYGSKAGGDNTSVPLAISYFEMSASAGQGNATGSSSRSPAASSPSNGALRRGVLGALVTLLLGQWMFWVGNGLLTYPSTRRR